MQNENKLVPDFRPETIQTYTETYTPEGGSEQTATYKIGTAHPIISGILDKLAWVRTHVAAVWWNKLAGVTLKNKIDAMDESITQLNSKKVLHYTDYNHGTIEIGTGNYANLMPPGEKNYLFATIITFGSTSSPFSVAGYARNFFVIGVKGNIIPNLQIRYWYTD